MEKKENTGRFKKGNEIGKETRFKVGHKMSNKYKTDYPESLLAYGAECKAAGIPAHKEEWAALNGIAINTLSNWEKEHPQFASAMQTFESLQKVDLVNGGLSGRYNAQLVKFLLSANHGMSEKAVADTTVTFKVDYNSEIDEESN